MSTDDQTAFTPKPNQPTSETLDGGTLSDSDNEFLAELDQALATKNFSSEDAPVQGQPVIDNSEPVTTLDLTPQPKFYLAGLKRASFFGQRTEPKKALPTSKTDRLSDEEYQTDTTKKSFSDDTAITVVHEAEPEPLANPYFHISENGFTVPTQRPVTSSPITQTTIDDTPQENTSYSNISPTLNQEQAFHHKGTNSGNNAYREEHTSHITEIWGTIALWSAFFCLVAFGIAIWYSNDMADRTLRLETVNKDLNSKVNELLKRVDIITQALVSAEQRIKQVDQRLGHQIILFTRYTAKRSEASQPREALRTLRNNQRQLANPQLEIISSEQMTPEDSLEDKPRNRSRRGRRTPR